MAQVPQNRSYMAGGGKAPNIKFATAALRVAHVPTRNQDQALVLQEDTGEWYVLTVVNGTPNTATWDLFFPGTAGLFSETFDLVLPFDLTAAPGTQVLLAANSFDFAVEVVDVVCQVTTASGAPGTATLREAGTGPILCVIAATDAAGSFLSGPATFDIPHTMTFTSAAVNAGLEVTTSDDPAGTLVLTCRRV